MRHYNPRDTELNSVAAYLLGRLDYKDNPSTYKNPYCQGSVFYNEYQTGWIEANRENLNRSQNRV